MTSMIEKAARAEREHIVAWLRERASRHLKFSLRERLFFIWTAAVWPENLFTEAWIAAADAIERPILNPQDTSGSK